MLLLISGIGVSVVAAFNEDGSDDNEEDGKDPVSTETPAGEGKDEDDSSEEKPGEDEKPEERETAVFGPPFFHCECRRRVGKGGSIDRFEPSTTDPDTMVRLSPAMTSPINRTGNHACRMTDGHPCGMCSTGGDTRGGSDDTRRSGAPAPQRGQDRRA